MSAAPQAARVFRQVGARGVYQDFGRRRALAGVDVTLRAGEAAVLLGDNGAGKSTLLSVLATLLRPTRGRVLFDDHPAEALEPAALRAALGVLAHEPRCYADLSARENLRFFGRLYGLDSAQRSGAPSIDGQPLIDRAEALLDRLSLRDAADRPARTYSRGMLQRLAVARTLLPRPGVLLLDEPYTGLDRGGVALLTTLLQEEVAAGAIVLVISHDLEAVAPLCDRALLLRGGRLIADRHFDRGAATAAALAALYSGGAQAA